MNKLLSCTIYFAIAAILSLTTGAKAKTEAQSLPTKPRVLEILNPWDGRGTLDKPMVQFQGDPALYPTVDRTDLCGWSEMVLPANAPNSVRLRSSATGQTWGKDGMGSTDFVDISDALALGDTAWIDQSFTGKAAAFWAWDGTLGACMEVKLAGIVRDFNNSNSSFNNRGNCYGTGYVQPFLNANRKIIPTHKADNCNPGDSLRMANNWFTTDPTYTKSAETCVDIPLDRTASETYTYNNQEFFPIDTFRTLPNGNPNPFNVQYQGDYGVMHNYSFCMEMHGTFAYRKGQVFDFTGDDDFWFFVNNKIAVDLGGLHGAMNGSVNLDNLGLAPGSSYPWDLFYCERMKTGSDLRITTSMDLHPAPVFKVLDSMTSPTRHVYTLWVSTKVSIGCVPTEIQRKSIGKYTLTGGNLTGPSDLPIGTSFGGIEVSQDLGSVAFDSTALRNLTPGNYVLHIGPVNGTGNLLDIPFSITNPRFDGIDGSLTDSDADGRADLLNLTLPVDASLFTAVRVQWPDTNGVLEYRRIPLSTSGRSLSIPVPPFSFGATSCPASASSPLDTSRCNNLGKMEVVDGNDTTLIPFPVHDAVVPIILSAQLRYAKKITDLDTLNIVLSEPVKPVPGNDVAWISWGRPSRDSAGRIVVEHKATLSPDGTRLTLLVDSTFAPTNLDSVRLTAAPVGVGSDLDGNRPLLFAHWSPLQIGPKPINFNGTIGSLTDYDADGRADLLNLTLPVDASLFTAVRVQWPDTNGVLEYRRIPLSTWGRLLSIPVPPFSFGATSCPASASSPLDTSRCNNLGKMEVVDGNDTTLIPFPVHDAVVPIILSAQLRYAKKITDLDTLNIVLSEPVKPVPGNDVAWISWGRPSRDSAGRIVVEHKATLSPDGTRLTLLVDSTFAPTNLDSVRLTAAPVGVGSDLDGNRPLLFAHWSPLQIGPKPINFNGTIGSLTDYDADGRADLLNLTLPVDASLFTAVRVQWPDTNGVLEYRRIPLSTWGRLLSIPVPPFSFGATSCPASASSPLDTSRCNNLGKMEVVDGNDTTLIPFPVHDAVVPIILSAQLRYAKKITDLDTLNIILSEPVKPVPGNDVAWISWGRPSRDSAGRIVVEHKATLSPDGTRLTLLVDSTFAPTNLDSVRLTAAPVGVGSDLDGNRPLLFAHWSPLQIGPKPINFNGTIGSLTDYDADGRADLLNLTLPVDASLFTAVRVQWPDTNGVLEYRRIPLSTWGRLLSIPVPPFSFGATSCPASASSPLDTSRCNNLGKMEVVDGNDTTLIPFPVHDAVVPIILSAQLRYAKKITDLDTLNIILSEPVKPVPGNDVAWISWGRPSRDSAGRIVVEHKATLSPDGTRLTLLVDSTFAPTNLDSVRLTAAPVGVGSDLDGNRPLLFAHWSPLQIGPKPINFNGTIGSLTDYDADGRADLLNLTLPVDASLFTAVRVQWPDTNGVLEYRRIPLNTSGRLLSIPVPPFSFGATSCPASASSPLDTSRCNNLGKMEVVDGNDTTLIPFPVHDAVVPIILSAQLRYAKKITDLDTLNIVLSEPVKPVPGNDVAWISWGRPSRDSAGRIVVEHKATLSPDGTRLTLLVDSTFAPTNLDSVRLTAAPVGVGSDLDGNRPLLFAHWSPLQIGPKPINFNGTIGSLTDYDADGRADLLNLTLPVDASLFTAVRVQWPDTNGVLEYRRIPLSTWGRLLSIPVPPFSFGATSCPASASSPLDTSRCNNLGKMEVVDGNDTTLIPFPVHDAVVPIILSAQLRYAKKITDLDTLNIILSEPVKPVPGNDVAWISWGRPSRDSAGRIVVEHKATLSPDGTRLTLLVDSTFAPTNLDSVRLTAAPVGVGSDLDGNRPLLFAHWSPLQIGPMPPRLALVPKSPLVFWSGWDIPTSEPSLQVLVRDANGHWVTLTGSAPAQDTLQYVGALLTFNQAIHGTVRLYDNIGVYGTTFSLDAIEAAVEQGRIPRDARGNAQCWIVWNGLLEKRIAPSGIYLLRAYCWMGEGAKRTFVNQILKMGWSDRPQAQGAMGSR